MRIEITEQDRDTILAALRFYQHHGMGEPDNRPDWLQDIACPTDNDTSLADDGIDDLCMKLNPPRPTGPCQGCNGDGQWYSPDNGQVVTCSCEAGQKLARRFQKA